MTPIALAIYSALVVHHRKGATITYGDLAQAAGYSGYARHLGKYLLEIAEWCDRNENPPLNALAVNAKTRRPGPGYDGAGQFRLADWDRDVKRTLAATWPSQPP